MGQPSSRVEREIGSAPTNPGIQLARVANDQSIRRDSPRYHCASSDEREMANGYAWQDSSISADGGAVVHRRRQITTAIPTRSWPGIVRESHVGADKYVIV